MNEKIKEAMDTMLSNVEKVIKRLQTNQKQMFVLITDNCPFCSEYLEKLKLTDLGIPVHVLNAGTSEEGQVLSLLMRMEKLPATVFMGQDNKIKGVVYGIPTEQDLKQTLLEI